MIGLSKMNEMLHIQDVVKC